MVWSLENSFYTYTVTVNIVLTTIVFPYIKIPLVTVDLSLTVNGAQ